jgi:hypothetical protein
VQYLCSDVCLRGLSCGLNALDSQCQCAIAELNGDKDKAEGLLTPRAVDSFEGAASTQREAEVLAASLRQCGDRRAGRAIVTAGARRARLYQPDREVAAIEASGLTGGYLQVL